ncbi:Laminin subunit beta-1 [Halotydeus destructor]|nr:Laminin subunit beta-1 [Halotydeus destructor]
MKPLLVGTLLLLAAAGSLSQDPWHIDDQAFEQDVDKLRTKRQAPESEYDSYSRQREDYYRQQREREERRRQEEERRRQQQAGSRTVHSESGSYLSSRQSSTGSGSGRESSSFRWETPARGSDVDQQVDTSYRRTFNRRKNITITRTRTGSEPIERTRTEHVSGHSLFSRNNQSTVEDIFGPVRVTDHEIDANSRHGQTSGGSYFSRHDVSTATGSRTSSGSGTSRVQNPLLWSNRTYHWSMNRSRPDYDPDLDGTTTPSSSDSEWPDYEDYYVHPWAVKKDDHCDPSSQACHPEVGDLLVGRADKLETGSTCGRERPERYCLISDLTHRKKCYSCKPSLPQYDPFNRTSEEEAIYSYHGIENIIQGERDKFWWQASPSEQSVTITINLEAEFHFTHLWIIFKTYRPAAMLIERSQNRGKSWSVYQYFAQDCAKSFPGVRIGERRSLADVVCTPDYTQVDKSTKGEVVFKVVPSTAYDQVRRDPFAMEVQDLLRVTNLRINMTKLQTLGDNLLDSGENIKEKYFYAIEKMMVRGSCSCYGHASRCVAAPGQREVRNMVYGTCECTHHTNGTNCEDCEDLYNDLEWKPGMPNNPNPCQKCECYGHATSCKYDAGVFAASKGISGGVCTACMHNTGGIHCEECQDGYYRESFRPLTDPCYPCNCDPSGTIDNECNSYDDPASGQIAGQCRCKDNVDGKRCDTCKRGHWDFSVVDPEGCKSCGCNSNGTLNNLGECNPRTGDCLCKRTTTGQDCGQCLPEYYGLSEAEEGCKACDCDQGGAYDNNCDQVSGQCRCRPNVIGRRCDQPQVNYFSPYIDHVNFEAEDARATECQVTPRTPYPDSPRFWTGSGYTRCYGRSSLVFDVNDVPATLNYDAAIRYQPHDQDGVPRATVTLERLAGLPDPSGPCRNANDAPKSVVFQKRDMQVVAVPDSFCLERGQPYRIRIDFQPGYDASGDVLLDSLTLIPRPDQLPFYPGNDNMRFELNRCLAGTVRIPKEQQQALCDKHLLSTGFYIFNGALPCDCDLTGSLSGICNTTGGQCTCKPNVIGRQCDQCAPGFFNFGPNGCEPCDCHPDASLDNFCDPRSGQCKCKAGNTFGRTCGECQPGYWDFPQCVRCNCNGHSETCDSKTGRCTDCRASSHTAGDYCEKCEHGFYGDPLTGIACRPCPCPMAPGSGISHADTCELDRRTGSPICNCLPGYAGERCDRCADNYFGSPNVIMGTCNLCNCSGNTDMNMPGNCDSRTGECLRCLYNTEGDNCQHCRPGFWGDASKQQCTQCVCNRLGTDTSDSGLVVCDRVSGQCPCLPNVVGRQCDECRDNHFNFSSGTGCEACGCDFPRGAYSEKCNLYDGQCHCKPERGDRKCDQCKPNHWGDPKAQCFQCNCVMSGSATSQCDRTNGSCTCLPGIGGYRCDQCARGYLGQAPHCTACGECFNNWDYTIQRLKEETQRLIDNARKIKNTGTPGAYSEEFKIIETRLTEIQRIVDGATITKTQIDDIDKLTKELRDQLSALQLSLQLLEDKMEETNGRATDANLALNNMKAQVDALTAETMAIKENMTALQEANVEGAFNLTRDAQRRSAEAGLRVRSTQSVTGQSAIKRSDTESMLENYGSRYNQTYRGNEQGLEGLDARIRQLENNVPDINNYVCDGRGSIDQPCDALCGGAGCSKCGGISCDQGATHFASEALNLGNESRDKLSDLQDKARKELNGILGAKSRSDEALEKAILAYERALEARNTSKDTTEALQTLLGDIDKFLDEEGSKPADVRVVAEQCLALEMSLKPDEILGLARQINETMNGITNIQAILVDTAGDLSRAVDLKRRGDNAKKRADDILDTARQVLDALDRARDAQAKAQEAIRKATQDIDEAKGDLGEIAAESEVANVASAKAQEEIARLQERLDQLRPKFSRNKIDVQRAAEESNHAGILSKQIQDSAGDLEKQFDGAKNMLDRKAKDSGANKQRAERLRERARALMAATSGKLKELQDIEDELDNNERLLKDYQSVVDKLNSQMLVHLNDIERKAEFHRSCVP